MHRFFLLIIIFLPFIVSSQDRKELEIYEINYQNCLDKGQNMLGCTLFFYNQTDSLLNIIYKKIYYNLDNKRKLELKTSQLKWLKKRDEEFKKFEKNYNEKDLGINDNKMIVLDKKAVFVMERVYWLNDFK